MGKSGSSHRRWGKNPRAVTLPGERIRHIAVRGRTTACGPTRQREATRFDLSLDIWQDRRLDDLNPPKMDEVECQEGGAAGRR